MKILRSIIVGLFAFLGIGSANATPFDITPTGESWIFQNCNCFGSARSIYFLANQNFSISSASYFGSLQATNYTLGVYQGLGEGSAAGTLLASSSANLPATTYQWNTINLSYSFLSGVEYFLSFGTTNLSWMDNGNGQQLNWGNGPQQSNLGLLTLLDGGYGTPPGNGNSWLTHFQIEVGNSVPEPASLALLGLGLFGLGFSRRKKA